jgi:hypothetical protein
VVGPSFALRLLRLSSHPEDHLYYLRVHRFRAKCRRRHNT